ncbi:hypothetical protein CKA32_006406 [Geitlerinema sp. FC II]|nr:hypothetical protein CKA32_006406 [Geitlerinema sp. FC II]
MKDCWRFTGLLVECDRNFVTLLNIRKIRSPLERNPSQS